MSRPLRVLIVEDIPAHADLLVWQLRRGGYEVTFERVDTAPAFSSALESGQWDVILSDYTLPRFNALEALKETLIKYKGKYDGYIHLVEENQSETVIYLGKDLRLNICEEIRKDADRILGSGSTRFV